MFIDHIRSTIKKYALVRKGDTVIAGVSGGPDSSAMLLALAELKDELGFSLQVAHFNHGTRRGSSADARFVQRVSDDLGLPCSLGRPGTDPGSVPGSLEEQWRKQRLAFFARVGRKAGTRLVALAHTRDDQAETVLMRIIRGTGLYGLAGMLPQRQIDGLTVIRPLLEVSRADVSAYLRRRKLKARLDPSNKRDAFFRNRVRNRLLPLLEREYHRGIRDSLVRLGSTAGLDYDFIERTASRSFGLSARRFSVATLLKTHPAVRRLAYRSAIASVAGSTRRITLAHIAELDDLLLHRPSGSIVDLPRGVSCVRAGRYLLFGSSSRS